MTTALPRSTENTASVHRKSRGRLAFSSFLPSGGLEFLVSEASARLMDTLVEFVYVFNIVATLPYVYCYEYE